MSKAEIREGAKILNKAQKGGADFDTVKQYFLDKGWSESQFNRVLENKDKILERSKKARVKREALHNADHAYIKELMDIVGSKGNRDISYAGWASTPESAKAYLLETDKKDWGVEENDFDGDGIPEVIVIDPDGVHRRINGWGVRESKQAIRKNYYQNNPTKSDRRNVTFSEWTRGVAVDREGKLDYLFPNAERFTNSQKELYSRNPAKQPKADAKKVWQQYVAKPFLYYTKNKANIFDGIDALPSKARSTLSSRWQQESWLYIRAFTVVNSLNNSQSNIGSILTGIILNGRYSSGTDEEKASITKQFNSLAKNVPQFNDSLTNNVINTADALANDPEGDDLVLNDLRQLIKKLIENIIAEFKDFDGDNYLEGYDRIKERYGAVRLGNRSNHKGLAGKTDKQLNYDESLRRLSPARKRVALADARDYNIYVDLMNKFKANQGDYSYFDARSAWKREAPHMLFEDYMLEVFGNPK